MNPKKGALKRRREQKQSEAASSDGDNTVEEEDDDHNSNAYSKCSKLYHCTNLNCTASFIRKVNLEKHLDSECHFFGRSGATHTNKQRKGWTPPTERISPEATWDDILEVVKNTPRHMKPQAVQVETEGTGANNNNSSNTSNNTSNSNNTPTRRREISHWYGDNEGHERQTRLQTDTAPRLISTKII